MPDSPPVCAVVLAAGRAERFGGGKLGVALAGAETVLARTVRGALDPSVGAAGVWLAARRAEAAPWLGPLAQRVHWVEVEAGGGQGDSLAAAARALPPGARILVVLGDMPLSVPGAAARTVAALAHAPAGTRAAACVRDGVRMPPAVFAAPMRPGIEALGGDRGARALLGGAGVAEVDPGGGPWHLDLDRPGDLGALRQAAEEERGWR